MHARRWPEVALIALAALILAACGQKGPLILPPSSEAGATPGGESAAEQPTRDEDDDR